MVKKYGFIIEWFWFSFEAILILGMFFALQIHSSLGSRQFPAVDDLEGGAWNVVPTVLLLTAAVFAFVFLHRLVHVYFDYWRRNGMLAVFILLAGVSLIWSVYPAATGYKLVFLFSSTLFGAYTAVRFELRKFIDLVTGYAVLAVALSVVLLIFIPNAIMMNEPYTGSWRGMFWHRNHAGDLIAYFSALFLYRILFLDARATARSFFILVCYAISTILVFGSRSATGIVVFSVLHLAIVAWWVWMKLRERMKKRHYLLAGAIFILASGFFFFNTAFFFGLLGRSSNMTGRLPLWNDLFFNIWTQKPWLGYGYGALWMQESFRTLMADRQGWKLFPVFFSDNGFLDILLNLGLVGLLAFAAAYLTRWIQSILLAVGSGDNLVFFLPLTFLFVFVGNLSYSFLLEVDQFVWMLLVSAIFGTTRIARELNPAAP